MARILLHTCCAPCSIHPIDQLRAQGHEITSFFYNPNIHPFTEHLRRKETLFQYAKMINLPIIDAEKYDFEEYLRRVAHRVDTRCGVCYEMRLMETARAAKEKGFEAFSTTLLVSPYQKHDMVREVAEAVSREYGVPFIYQDWRGGFRAGQARAKELGLYRQPYCGCIYSEAERYRARPPKSLFQGVGK